MITSVQERCNDLSLKEESSRLSLSELKKRIEKMAEEFHDPQLIDMTQSPNGNTIYILWGDLEITDEISYAFGQRSVRTFSPPLYFQNVFEFPFQRGDNSGIILTVEDCKRFRNWIVDVIQMKIQKKNN